MIRLNKISSLIFGNRIQQKRIITIRVVFILCIMFFPFFVQGQYVYVPGGTAGIIDNSTNSNVGIDILNPKEKFHVSQGNIIVDNGYYFRGLKTDGAVANMFGTTTGTNQLRFGSGGWSSITFDVADAAARLFIDNEGEIGIGTSQPEEKLHVSQGNLILDNGFFLRALTTTGQKSNIFGTTTGTNQLRVGSGNWSSITFDVAGSAGRMFINDNGNVLVGKTTQDDLRYILDVAGPIRATEVKVESGWADFVFQDDYKLMSLSDLENFIQQNGHLPEIPTESQVKKDGVDLGEMNKKLLQKVEELTLYVIELNKEIEKLKSNK